MNDIPSVLAPDLASPDRKAAPVTAHRNGRGAALLGILVLETAPKPLPGEVGYAGTFAFPVQYGIVSAASVRRVAGSADDALLALFIHAADELVRQGCTGIATTCSVLGRWQREMAASLSVPVLTSALLQVPLVQRLLPHRQHVGVVSGSTLPVDPASLNALGADSYFPIEVIDAESCYATTLHEPRMALDAPRIAAEVVAAARRLVGDNPHTGAIVLEGADLPPYRDAVEAAMGIPVYDAAQLITWFHAGLRRRRPA